MGGVRIASRLSFLSQYLPGLGCQHGGEPFYLASLSARTLLYQGMMLASEAWGLEIGED